MRTDRFLCVFTAKTHTDVCCAAFGHREAGPHSSLLRPFSVWQKSWSIVQSQAVLSSTVSPFIICRLRQSPCRATLDPKGSWDTSHGATLLNCLNGSIHLRLCLFAFLLFTSFMFFLFIKSSYISIKIHREHTSGSLHVKGNGENGISFECQMMWNVFY